MLHVTTSLLLALIVLVQIDRQTLTWSVAFYADIMLLENKKRCR